MRLVCVLVGHQLGQYPYPMPVVYAVKLGIYRCRRCGKETTP